MLSNPVGLHSDSASALGRDIAVISSVHPPAIAAAVRHSAQALYLRYAAQEQKSQLKAQGSDG